uniref:Neur_chan_LBD domain-containing protein n=1 Tax=Steinernema glaseri TaxID=37863 RepID=A0A1I8ARY0_9BILA
MWGKEAALASVVRIQSQEVDIPNDLTLWFYVLRFVESLKYIVDIEFSLTSVMPMLYIPIGSAIDPCRCLVTSWSYDDLSSHTVNIESSYAECEDI